MENVHGPQLNQRHPISFLCHKIHGLTKTSVTCRKRNELQGTRSRKYRKSVSAASRIVPIINVDLFGCIYLDGTVVAMGSVLLSCVYSAASLCKFEHIINLK